MPKTRVVVVDDSALVRSMLTEIINRQPDMECIGAAADPFVAREMIRNLNPDVINWTWRCRAWTVWTSCPN